MIHLVPNDIVCVLLWIEKFRVSCDPVWGRNLVNGPQSLKGCIPVTLTLSLTLTLTLTLTITLTLVLTLSVTPNPNPNRNPNP